MALQLIEKDVKDLFNALQERFTTSDNVELSVYDEMVSAMASKLNEKLLKMYEKEKKPRKQSKKEDDKVEVIPDKEVKAKPLNAYMKFCKEKRDAQKGLSAKMLGEMWKALTKDEQKAYK